MGSGGENREIEMPHVTGIGGVFFKSKGDNKALAAWYKEHLGVDVQPWGGAIFRWSDDPAKDKGATAWNIDERNSTKYKPSDSSFRINYRVDDLEGILGKLQKAGLDVQGPERSEYGKFAWLMDPEGNSIELWEP